MDFFNQLIDVSIEKDMGIYNTTDEFFCLFLNKISNETGKNILMVVNTIYEANKLYNSLIDYHKNTYLFPMDDFLTSEALAISPDLMINRLETINKVLENKQNIVITNLMGYLRFLPMKEEYEKSIIDLKVGSIIEPNQLVEKLSTIGYTRDTLVNKTGEFGVRGFIIDVFPIDEENPIRIEFFDDEIESIRYFNPDTQKSISKIEEIKIKPFSEFLTTKNVVEEHFSKQKYLPKYTKTTNIGDYLDDNITIFKDYEQLDTSYLNILEDTVEIKSEKDSDFEGKYMNDFSNLSVEYPIYYYSLNNLNSNEKVSKMYDFGIKTINNLNEDSEQINEFIRKQIDSKKTVIICLKKYQIRSMRQHLNMKLLDTTFENIHLGQVNVVEGELSRGFIYKDFVVLTAKELFKNVEKKNRYSTKYKYSSTIEDINKLSIGDYVVHNVHGIGIYNGIKTLTLNNIAKDYLEILYQGTDKIYIPVEKIEYLTKFSGREGVVPKVNKLGGTEWQKTKTRIRNKVTDIASRLIKLYAERESRKGFAFSPDCDLSIDFENDFQHELTVDQKRAIIQIKQDMESPVPMDRLLCGDVGFGKLKLLL